MNNARFSFILFIFCVGIMIVIYWSMNKTILALTKTFENMEGQIGETIVENVTGGLDWMMGKGGGVGGDGIGIVSMMKQPKNIEIWLQHHRDIGIQKFYIRLEETPELESFLKNEADVVLLIGKSTGVNEYNEKQVRQTQMVNEVLKRELQVKDGRLSWLIQIDSDELLRGDLNEIRELPKSVRTFWMSNIEAVYEKVLQNDDSCFQAATFRECGKSISGECVSYGNGKGGGRVAPDVVSNGSHRFASHGMSNVAYSPKEVHLEKVIVEHYESCDFDSYKDKYVQLANNDTNIDIPFSYYNESIEAAKTGDDDVLKCVYEKHRTVLGNKSQDCLSKGVDSVEVEMEEDE